MRNPFKSKAFVVIACVLGSMSASAQDEGEAASVKVGKDGNVRVKAPGATIEARDGSARVRGGGVDIQANGAAARDDDDAAETTSQSEGSLELVDSDRTVKHDCGEGGKVEIVGSSNQVILTGTCEYIEVTGSENKVSAHTVRRIETTGSDNNVVWKQGPQKGKKPRISNTGTNNRISQAR
jgi:predicted ribonuclease YlaK